jgi:hypothetical protein
MATYRPLLVGLLAVAAAATGCGSGSHAPSSGAAFAWLRPAPAPTGWLSTRLPAGATIAFPPGWHAIKGDRGTASAALLDGHGHYLGYLNLTPRQGAETFATWPAFRVRHNAAEGDREVKADGTAADLRFRTGRGTCVRDAYATSLRTRYVEIACLVAGEHATWVVVGAASRDHWTQEQSVIERAISALVI